MSLYDELPWKGQPLAGTAPEQLAVASWARGGPCPRVRGARVLELGCGTGANLIPMAWHRPDCEFVGLDASALHVTTAEKAIAALGLGNVRVELADLRDLDAGEGRFEFILAHGLLSWVAPPVRGEILALLRRHLTPDGLAYLSFNAMPGQALRGVVRDLLRRATRREDPPHDQAAAARATAAWLAGLADGTAAGDLPLRDELTRIAAIDDAEIVHDYLADENHPLWFGDFVAEAEREGLRYVGPARGDPDDWAPAAAVAERLAGRDAGPLPTGEVVDVLGFRRLHRAIVCREEAPSDAIAEPTVASGLPERGGSTAGPAASPARFDAADGAVIEVADPHLAMALRVLAHGWPAGRDVASLADDVARLGGGRVDVDLLRGQFLDLYLAGRVDLRLREPRCRVDVGERPVASPLTRLESTGDKWTTPFHVVLPTTPAERALVTRLDGRPLPDAAREAGMGPAEAHAVVTKLAWWGLLA